MPYLRALLMTILATTLSVAIGCGAKEPPRAQSGSTDSAKTGGVEAAPKSEPGQQIADLPGDDFGLPDLTIPTLSEPSTETASDEGATGGEKASAEVPDASYVDGLPTDHSAGDVIELTPEKETSSDDDKFAMVAEAEASGKESIAPPPPPVPTPAGSPALPRRQDPKAANMSSSNAGGVVRREGSTKDHKGYSAERVFFATNREPAAGRLLPKIPICSLAMNAAI